MCTVYGNPCSSSSNNNRSRGRNPSSGKVYMRSVIARVRAALRVDGGGGEITSQNAHNNDNIIIYTHAHIHRSVYISRTHTRTPWWRWSRNCKSGSVYAAGGRPFYWFPTFVFCVCVYYLFIFSIVLFRLFSCTFLFDPLPPHSSYNCSIHTRTHTQWKRFFFSFEPFAVGIEMSEV